MADPFAPEGLLPNVLRWIDRPGQAVRNVFRGNLGAAGRQIADFAMEPIDAALPGDWIPEATGRQDYVSGSELVGMDENAPWWQKVPTDIAVSLATDPLTYLSFGASAGVKGAHAVKAGVPFWSKATVDIPGLDAFAKPVDPLSLAMRGGDKAVTSAASYLDQTMDTGTAIGAKRTPLQTGWKNVKGAVRRTFGAEDLANQTKQSLATAGAVGNAGSKYWTTQVEALSKDLSKQDRTLLGKAMLGVDYQAGKAIPLNADYHANLLALTGDATEAARLGKYADAFADLSKRQWEEGVNAGVFEAGPGGSNYVQRQWYLPEDKAAAAASAGKTLQTPQDVANFLDTQKDVALETDIVRLMAQRASQQGGMLGKARVAKAYGGTGAKLSELQTSAKQQVEQLSASGAINEDEVYAITKAIDGMDPRTGVLKALSGFNSIVKGPMVYGIIVPKVGSMVRNKIGMAWQALSEPGAREQALPQFKSLFSDIGKAWDEAYGDLVFGTGKRYARSDEIGKAIVDIEDAMKAGKNTDDALAILANKNPDAYEAMQSGVLDGFVSTEELVNRIGRNPGAQKWKDLRDAPGTMFQALEQRGRLQMFLNLKRGGMPVADAAQTTKNALYDYGISSEANRNMRDIIPFGQFMAKAIPQNARLLSQRPAAAAGLAPMFYDSSGEEAPVYPWMQGKSRISVGLDEQKNPLYLTGFGLPVEALDTIPNLSGGMREAGRDVSQGLLSASNPLVKTGIAFATGKDPYFGTAFGSYDKIPMVGSAGAAGRAYNMAASTGLLEPIGGGIMRQIGQATDETKSAGARVGDLLTGAKLVSVDPDVAEQRAITDYLEMRPDVKQYRTFYQQEPDPEFGSLMKQLQEAKARVKTKREAAATAGL